MIITQPVNYGGRIYEAGENVRGKLPADMLILLQNSGVIQQPEAEADPSESKEREPMSLAQLAEYVQSIEDPEKISALLSEEQSGEKPRSGAISLFEKRLKELQHEQL